MKFDKLLRMLLFAAVAALHIILILFMVINTAAPPKQELGEQASVMKLVDVDEHKPPPPPEEEAAPLPMVEAIAETMIETDVVPQQTVVAAGTLTEAIPAPAPVAEVEEHYLPQHLISIPPKFDERVIYSTVVYPPIAQRSGIEGRVILELFIDRTGLVRQVVILQEVPAERGFGEAAVKAFSGIRVEPALANGEPVSCRFRYPVRFVLK